MLAVVLKPGRYETVTYLFLLVVLQYSGEGWCELVKLVGNGWWESVELVEKG